MVGTTLASAIGANTCLGDKTVLLLEGAPTFKGFHSDEFSNRVSTLNNGTIKLMKAIGAWEHIVSVRQKPVREMQVSECLNLSQKYCFYKSKLNCLRRSGMLLVTPTFLLRGTIRAWPMLSRTISFWTQLIAL